MERANFNRQNDLRSLGEFVKQWMDYRAFYASYCPQARIVRNRLTTRCPLPSHGHSGRGQPGFSVDLRRGLFHCFSRNEGGDAIRFYELMHDVNFPAAVRALADLAAVNFKTITRPAQTGNKSVAALTPPLDKPLNLAGTNFQAVDAESLTEESLEINRLIIERFLELCRGEEQIEGVNYLARRGISRRAMSRAGVTYFPRRAYAKILRALKQEFPLDELQTCGLFNADGHLTFYRHRLLFPFYVNRRAVYLQARTTASGVEPRWHNLRGNVPAFYNLDALKKLSVNSVVYLVEGFTDTLTLMTHRFTGVGIVGAGGLKPEWIDGLKTLRVVAVLDGDEAGCKALEHYRVLFAERRIALANIELNGDVNDFFRARATAALEWQLLTEAALDSR